MIGKIRSLLEIDEAQNAGRDHHIDALKGFTILLVVVGHSIQVHDAGFDDNLLFRMIYSFHMPLFMFLSGFILFTQLGYSFPRYVRKNAVRLVVPFVVWYLISYIAVRLRQDVSLLVYFWDLVKAPGRGLWFLWALFLNSALLFGVLKLVRYKNWLRFENHFVIAAILLSRAASPDFLGLSDVRQFFIYYATGFWVWKYQEALKARRKIIYAAALAGFPVLALCWKRNDFPTFYPALLQLFQEPKLARLVVSLHKYAVSFLGFAFSSLVVAGVRKTWVFPFLSWLGMFTLDIYACHSYFLIGLGSGVFEYFSGAFICLVLSLVLTLLILRRFKITRLLLLGQSR